MLEPELGLLVNILPDALAIVTDIARPRDAVTHFFVNLK